MSKKREPDLFAVVRWVKELDDPVEKFVAVTLLIDKVRDQLLSELAGLRRISAADARTALMDQGYSASGATAKLSKESGASPQTIGRMISERHSYGYED